MHVGMAAVFQNTGRALSDHQIYLHELALADMAEPLGFDSIWSVEHHFTDYTMCPDVVQFLTYMAGRTKNVQLGSMVVLPWHDPVRVAEEVCMLDALSGGRMIFGIGRGLGRVEFEGFRVPMDESRERFVEAAEGGKTRVVLEQPIEVSAGDALAHQVEERTWIDRAGARCAGQPFERREPHRRVDGAPVADRGDRAASAEVAHDEVGNAHLLARPLHRQSVEPVAANLAAPVGG